MSGSWTSIAATLVVVSALAALWRREVSALVRIVALQGASVALVALSLGISLRDGALLGAGLLVLVVKAGAVPWVLSRTLRQLSKEREMSPLVNVPSSLLVGLALVGVAVFATRSLVSLDPSRDVALVPFGVATSVLGYFLVVSRRRAVSQIVGLVMVDNGIAVSTFLLTGGVPTVLELGGSLDVLLIVVILRGVRLAGSLSDLDLSERRELRE